MVNGSAGKARFVVENYGASELARRFGVRRYPAIFVGDVLVATPKDFGFYGAGEGEPSGRYAPLRSAASHERLRADLERMIALLAAGRGDEARALAAPRASAEVAALPDFEVRDIEGRTLTRDDLAGRVVLVEFWATWCPPCRGTLAWLGEMRRRFGDRLAVVAFAVESDTADVRAVARSLDPSITWAMAGPELARAFGDLGAVPTLYLFDAGGATAGVYFGAPPGLHAELEAALAARLGGAGAGRAQRRGRSTVYAARSAITSNPPVTYASTQ